MSDEDGDEVERYVEAVNEEMDIREIVGAICDLRDDSKVTREKALEAAETVGIDRDEASRFMKEYISTTEIVELDGDWVQTRRHFDEGFE